MTVIIVMIKKKKMLKWLQINISSLSMHLIFALFFFFFFEFPLFVNYFFSDSVTVALFSCLHLPFFFSHIVVRATTPFGFTLIKSFYLCRSSARVTACINTLRDDCR